MESPKRLESLDALRGFDMLLICGLGMTVIGFCQLFPGGSDCWLANQFRHVKWEGLALWDTIFPLFVRSRSPGSANAAIRHGAYMAASSGGLPP